MNRYKKGFTLFEMMVSIGIFVMITTIGVLNYRKFGSDIFISNLAYDMALTFRKAQSYGTNVRETRIGGTGSFDYAYGLHFNIDTASGGAKGKYYLFVDAYSPNSSSCTTAAQDAIYDELCLDNTISPPAPKDLVETSTLLKNSQITSLCATPVLTGVQDCTIKKLDITYLRPNPDAVIKNPSSIATEYSNAEIHITSADAREKKIIIYPVGQISVQSVTP